MTFEENENTRLTLIVHGNVQKSDYRGRVMSIAKTMNITGIAENLSDGTVKIVAEGDRFNIERFIEEIDIRNFLIKVSKIDIKEEKYKGEYENFYKLVGEGETDERLDTAAELLKELIFVTRNGFDKVEKKLDTGFDKIEKKLDNR